MEEREENHPPPRAWWLGSLYVALNVGVFIRLRARGCAARASLGGCGACRRRTLRALVQILSALDNVSGWMDGWIGPECGTRARSLIGAAHGIWELEWRLVREGGV